MAKQAKGNGETARLSTSSSTMARGLAEIVAAHNLSELIVDTKDTTLTVRRGGVASAMPRCRCDADADADADATLPASARARARSGRCAGAASSTTSRTS